MRKVFLRVFAGLFAAAFMAASVSYAGTTEIVSVDSNGKLGNGNSDDPTISADGRYVAFSSAADNLVQGDTNGKSDIFVHDRQTGETKIISKDSNGKLGNNNSYVPAISADGRYVAFRSLAGNLVQGDTNGKSDIFVHDRQTGETIIISKDSSGKQGNNHSYEPAISADGRFVAFWSLASNLVPGDTNDKEDIFVHDRKTGETKIISKDSNGKPGNNFSRDPAISPNGRYVAFRSGASNLVPGDTNDKADIFVHDRQTGKTEIISKDSAGTQGTGPSSLPAISADGRFVAFESAANNLVPNDTNGETDAFVHDRQTGKTEIVSKDSTGIQGNGGRCFIPVISGDGRYVAFESDAGNLVPGDTNGKSDVFVRDRD
ncbi:MAG: hypothetical protein WC594_08430 [Thermodesulfovibrionales bacterium]